MTGPEHFSQQLPAEKKFGFAAILGALCFWFTFLLDRPYWAMILIAIVLAILSFSYLKWLLPALFFVLPFSINYSVGAGVNLELPFEALLLWTCFLLVYHWLRSDAISPKGILPVVLLLIFCWSGISCIFSEQAVFSLKYLLSKSAYLLVFVATPLILGYSFRDLKKLIWLSVIAIVSISIFVLIRQSAFSFEFGAVNQALTPFFENHVLYAAQLVCVLPWLVWLYRSSSSKKALLIFFSLILFIAILFSFSRGAWLAIPAAILGWQLLRRKLLLKAFLAAILFVVAATGWLVSDDHYLRFSPDFDQTVFHPDFAEHMEATYEGKDMSTAERFHRWVAAARMGADHWLLGTGPATFAESYQPYTVPAFRTWVSRNNEKSTVHNYWLLVWSEQGLPGLLLFLLLIGLLIHKLEAIYKTTTDRNSKNLVLTIAASLSILLTLNFLSDLMEAPDVSPFFYFSIGLILWLDGKDRKQIKS